jgi:transmembrane sensor
MNDSSADDHRFMDWLLFRVLKGLATPAEEEMVAQWCARSTANALHYEHLRQLLQLTADAHRPAAIDPAPTIADLLAGSEGRAMQESRGLGATSNRGRRRLIAYAVGAAVAGAVLAPFALRTFHTPQADTLFGADEFVTGPTDLSTLHLRDGTIVRLAPHSRLRFTGRGSDREVSLQGRAFFAVAKQKGRPFRVRTRAGDALVLGTRFEVSVDDRELRLIVVEGRVALSTPLNQVELKAGEMSKVMAGTSAQVSAVPAVKPMMRWMGSFLVFQATPLPDVLKEIEGEYGVTVQLADSSLSTQTVTAWFAERRLDEVMRVVCKVIETHCEVVGRVVTIGRRETHPSLHPDER